MTENKASTSKSSHPPTSKMVEIAILQMKERKGSSVQAIKKFIDANFEVNIDVIYPRIKTYLKTATEKGILLQVTGTGALGSFKISKERKDEINKEEKAQIKKLAQKTELLTNKKKVTPKIKAVSNKKMPSEKKKKMTARSKPPKSDGVN